MRLTDTNSMWESHAASALQYETDLASPIPFPKFFSKKQKHKEIRIYKVGLTLLNSSGSI